MCETIITKSDTDLSSNSSWSVIDETDDSKKSSAENIHENDSDNLNSSLNIQDVKEAEGTFINITDDKTKQELENEENKSEFLCFDEFQQETERTDENNIIGHCKLKGSKRRKKRKAEPLSIISIAASVLTITGITLLCMLFPQNVETEAMTKIQINYADIMSPKNATLENYLNKTAETIDIAKESNLFDKIKRTANEENFFISDEVCPANEQRSNETLVNSDSAAPYGPPNFIIPSEKDILSEDNLENQFDEQELINSFQQLQNKTIGLIQDLERILMNPNLQIFLCTLMQDICLIKLVKQLNKPVTKKSSGTLKNPNAVSKTDKKIKKVVILKKKLENKMKQTKNKNKDQLTDSSKQTEDLPKEVKNTISEGIFISPVNVIAKSNDRIVEETDSAIKEIKNERENGKSECERRFEELDNKWEIAGHNHRQKIQEIKENFKNEVLHIREQDLELSLRKKRINLVREKYVDRLKYDRENYLYQLGKLRDERQKIMRELCLKKNAISELKDASVGNYAVLLPDTYNFQQKLQLLRNRESNKPQINLSYKPPASVPKLGFIRTADFWNFQSIPNIAKVKSKKEDIESLNLIKLKREKYIERVKKYYDKKNKYLKKKALFPDLSKSVLNEKVETFTDNPFEDMISNMISTISESKSKFYRTFSNSSVETVKENETTKKENTPTPSVNDLPVNDQVVADSVQKPPLSINSQEFRVVVRKKPKKRDMYEVAFDGNSKKIKQDDMAKWNHERKLKAPQQPVISKQDPQKLYKEKIIIKGHI